jgi:hypothetical protein
MTPLSELADLLDLQSGVISRRQALAIPGESEASIRRRLRRREWVLIHPGVYVDHTGPVTWQQRAWAGVLAVAPAALCHESALRAADGPGRRGYDDDGPVHVAIDHRRTVTAPEGVVVDRMRNFKKRTQLNSSPPRVRIEHAVLSCAAQAAQDRDAISVLSDAVRSRRTTAARLLEALDSHRRIARRTLLAGVLTDAANGTHSVLEFEYLRRIERAHGLPRPMRQSRERSGDTSIYRDAEYPDYGIVIELDGRLGHTSAAERDSDFERDLDTALTQRTTIRIGWIQVIERSCPTARKMADLLRQKGWQGVMCKCPDCPDQQRVGLLSPVDRDPTR